MRLSCLLVVAAAALCPQPAQAAPGHAEIAFVSDDRIWASRADGSERRLLIAPTRPRESLSQPVWSPDGSTLAYVSAVETRRDDIEAAQLMAFDGTRSHAITPLRDGVVDFSPRWSPDGTALAFSRFVSERGFPSLVLTRQLDNGAERALASARIGARLSFVGEPSWSPDGTTIAYTRSALDRQHHFRPTIRTVAAAGGASRLLIPDARSPAWSPDGRLAFASVRDRNGSRCGSHECRYAAELYTSAADGSALTRLTRTKGDESAPVWSPDGSRILFTSDRSLPEGDSQEVYSVAADGSCLTWLTNGTPASELATWRPASGDRYDPGSCNASSRAALVDGPTPSLIRGGLWLGRRHRGLLLSRAERRFLSYRDCERFDPRDCPPPIYISSEPACRVGAFRGLLANAYRYVRVRGAIVAFSNRYANARVLSGHALTAIQLGGENRLADVLRVVRSLRTIDVSHRARRLPRPRIPRALARRLESSAGGRSLGRALRSVGPYRFSTCG